MMGIRREFTRGRGGKGWKMVGITLEGSSPG